MRLVLNRGFSRSLRVRSLVSCLALIVLMLLTMSIMIPNTQASNGDWPMFRNDSQHSGYSTSTAPKTNATLWDYATDSLVTSSPAVADGKVYVGSGDNASYCFDAFNGTLIWNFTTGYITSSPAVAGGNVYIGSQEGSIYCLNALTGTSVWNFTTGGPIFSSPAVANGKLFIGSEDHVLYCLNASTGTSVWNYTTSGLIDGSPSVAYGNIYIGSTDEKVYCVGLAGLADTTPPDITNVSQTPAQSNVSPQDIVNVNVTVTDDTSGVKEVILNYTSNNGTWTDVAMSNVGEDIWSASLPAFPYGTNVTYIITAQDNAGNTITTLTTGIQYQVIPEFPTLLIVLPLFLISVLLTVAFHRRRQARSASTGQEQAAEPGR